MSSKKLAAIVALVMVMALALALPLGIGASSASACYSPPEDPPCESTTINSATLWVYLSFARNVPPDLTVEVYRITAPWTETEVTWNSFAGSYDPVPVGSFVADSVGWRSVDLTALVQDWVDGTYPNYGVLLSQEVGLFNSYHSSEYWNVELRPKLEIDYTTGTTTNSLVIQRPGAEQDGVADTKIKQWEPDVNKGTEEHLSTAADTDTVCGPVDSLIRFEISIEPCPPDPEPVCPRHRYYHRCWKFGHQCWGDRDDDGRCWSFRDRCWSSRTIRWSFNWNWGSLWGRTCWR